MKGCSSPKKKHHITTCIRTQKKYDNRAIKRSQSPDEDPARILSSNYNKLTYS